MAPKTHMVKMLAIPWLLVFCCLPVFSQESFSLKYKLLQSPLKYDNETKISIVQEVMGSQFETNSTLNTRTMVHSEGIREDGLVDFILQNEAIEIRLKTFQMDSTLKNPAGLIGRRIKKTIRANGDQVASVELDSLAVPVGIPGLESAQEFFVNLPEASIGIGETLTETDRDTMLVMAGATEIESTTNFTLLERIQHREAMVLRIKVESEVVLNGKGKFNGMDFVLEGDGEVNGMLLFAPAKGHLLDWQNEMVVEMTINVSGPQSMSIPMKQTANQHVKLVEQ